MAERYEDILRCCIGHVSASVKADNYFPVVGETATLEAATKWGQSSEWVTDDGSGEAVRTAGNLKLQKDSKQVTIASDGELKQTFVGKNSADSVEVVKTLYAMQPQELPYFEVSATEVVRVGDTFRIDTRPENGYSRACTGVVRVYRENEEESPVLTLPLSAGTGTSELYATGSFTKATERGIYDIEVDVTDTASGQMLSKRINKLLTVTPQLCPKPSDTTTGYEVAATYQAQTTYSDSKNLEFEVRLWRDVDGSGLNYAEMTVPSGMPDSALWNAVDVSVFPAGTTLCLKKDPLEPDRYAMRLFLVGCTNQSVTSETGTPNLSFEAPLIITHDCEDIFDWPWRGYGSIVPGGNMRHIVIDGYGYHGTGIRFNLFDPALFADSCFYVNNGSSNWEIFGCDIDGAGFAGISAKTDPNPNYPWFWRENGWELEDLWIHHCIFQNTVGEGCYIGYFDTRPKSGTNSAGVSVTYQAHIVRDLRIYRSVFRNNGFDSVQINNSQGVDFCYNELDGCGYRREPSQGSAFSATMDGKIYNCVVKNNYNIVGVFGPYLERLEIFNCILTAARLDAGWVITSWTSDDDPDEVRPKDYIIHNNLVKSATIAKLTGDVSYVGCYMHDNVFITENGDTEPPGYFEGTGNVFMQADLDYELIDDTLKVADSANYDYQPAYNSQVVTAGANGLAPFDMRGYKNWYLGNYHAGPYMGKYKDLSVVDMELLLKAVVLCDAAVFTYDPEIKVKPEYEGTATRYRIGETSDLSGSEWTSLALDEDGMLTYTLSDGYGDKTVYLQLGGAKDESGIVSSTIEYRKEPIAATLVLNGGLGLTVSADITAVFEVTGVYETLEYMLSEDPDFAGVSYAAYTAGQKLTITLSAKGERTVYGRIRSEDGQVAEASVTVEYCNNKMIVAPGCYNNTDWYDEENGINRYRGWPPTTSLLNVAGEAFCGWKWVAGPTGTSAIDSMQRLTGQGTTGDNSGAYPDEYLAAPLGVAVGNTTSDGVPRITFTGLPAGNYKLRILCCADVGKGTWKPDDTVKSYILVNEQEYLVADLGLEAFVGNFNKLLEWDVEIVEGYELTVSAYCTTQWRFVPINLIELEDVS